MRYSHTPNIDDTGKATDIYGNNISTNDVVTIPGASKLHVKLYYSTEDTDYDWACVWAGSHPDYTASGNYSSSKLGTISGEIGDGAKTSMSGADVIEGDIDGDSVTFGFRSDGSGQYYGYYAVVTGYDESGKQIQEKQGHNVTKFGSMFSDCSSLENVDLSFFEGLTAEDLGYTFFGCSSLKEVTLPFSEYKNCSFSNTFRGCKSLEKISFPNAAAVKSTFRNAEGMFVNCRSLSTIDFSPFSVGDGLSASTESMFYGCENLESVKFSDSFVKSDCSLSNSSTMFFNCRKLKNIDLSSIKGKIKGSASSMFFNCIGAENIDMSNADTSELKDFSYMFNNCQSLKTLNISNFDTSSATNMHAMFNIDKNLQSLDISGFNTENVTDFTAMFYGCSSLADLKMKSNIIGEKTKTVNSMFAGCSALKSLDLHDSKPSSVTDFAYFLKGCGSLESVDLSGFDTASAENVTGMFYKDSALKQLDISSFNLQNVKKYYGMLSSMKSLEKLTTPQKADINKEVMLTVPMYTSDNVSYNYLPEDKSYVLSKAHDNVTVTLPDTSSDVRVTFTNTESGEKKSTVVHNGTGTLFLYKGEYKASAPQYLTAKFSVDGEDLVNEEKLDEVTLAGGSGGKNGTQLVCLNENGGGYAKEGSGLKTGDKTDDISKINIGDEYFTDKTGKTEPRLSGKDMENKLRAMIYEMYYAESNMMSRMSLSADDSYDILQEAVWYYTNPSSDKLSDEAKELTEAPEAPDSFQLTYQAGDGYQNFVVLTQPAAIKAARRKGRVLNAFVRLAKAPAPSVKISLPVTGKRENLEITVIGLSLMAISLKRLKKRQKKEEKDKE